MHRNRKLALAKKKVTIYSYVSETAKTRAKCFSLWLKILSDPIPYFAHGFHVLYFKDNCLLFISNYFVYPL